MTDREKEVYNLIMRNPMISQKELSDKLNIARSSIGVHISNLMKKGVILGKGYVLKDDSYIITIGGANIDIEGSPSGEFKKRDSNPGVIKRNIGGVGRNISENLALLGVSVKFVSAVGDDPNGQILLDHCNDKGMDTSLCEIVKGESTSTYLSILDDKKDMAIAISHMDVMKNITTQKIDDIKRSINGAHLGVLDTNLPKKTLRYILKNFSIPFIVDTVSTEKAKKLEGLYSHIDTLKPNVIEAETITGIKLDSDKNIKLAGEKLLDLGIKNIFISLGDRGIYYKNSMDSGFLKAPNVDVVSATGAGDAFLAGVTLGRSLDLPIKDQGVYGIASSLLSLKSKYNIPHNLSTKLLNKSILEVKECNFMKSI